MTKKLKVYLLIILSAACLACTLAGCKIGEPRHDDLLKGYDVTMTYYANGGFFNGLTNSIPVELHVKNDPKSETYNEAGVPFMEIAEKDTTFTVKRDGWDFVGWYVAATYPEGNAHAGEIKYTYTYDDNGTEKTEYVFQLFNKYGGPVTDADNGRPVFAREGVDEQILEGDVCVELTDEQVDKTRLVKADAPLYVCAKWKPSLRVVYYLTCADGVTYEDEAGNKYTNGSRLSYTVFSGDRFTPKDPLKLKGLTYKDTYYDKELTDLVTRISRADINMDELDPDAPEYPVYAEYIEGDNWQIIRNEPDKIRNMFLGLSIEGNKYYLLEDVDCKDISFTLKTADMVAKATVQGNGKKLSNLKFGVASARNGATYSVFGTLGEKFSLSNLVIENLQIEFNTGNTISLYAMWGAMEQGATVEGLTVNGITATVKITRSGRYIRNAQNDNRNQWLFGGSENDQAFLTAHAGKITVEGETTLTIN